MDFASVVDRTNLTSTTLHPSSDNLLPFALSLLPTCLVAAAVSTFVYIVHKDYSGFLSLGPGGTPSNFLGYLKITFLRLFALSNPHIPAPVPVELINTGFLKRGELPKRKFSRPVVAGIAPHRQTNQRPQQEIFDLLSASIRQIAINDPANFRIATSAFEKHCPGLFSVKKANPAGNGEVCHAHPSDGSMHMTLHPEDIKIVLEAGWGERHPLARGGWCTRFVPQGFVMIYAPCSEEEVQVVMEIIKAGIGWISGERFVPQHTTVQSSTIDLPPQTELCRECCQ